ncbi:uncharacterized protein Tco025E_09578, partial [Trypanosoma conorhini]
DAALLFVTAAATSRPHHTSPSLFGCVCVCVCVCGYARASPTHGGELTPPRCGGMLCRNLLRREGAEHTRRPPTRKEEEEEGRRRSARHDANTQGAQHVNSARGRFATRLRPHGAQPAKAGAAVL